MAISRMEGLLHAAPQSPQAVVSPNVYVTNARALSAEALARLAATLDVPVEALRALLTMLEQRHVPASTFDWTLRSSAKHYRALRAMLQGLPGDDPAVVTRAQESLAALDAGEFARATTVLHEAHAHALQRAQQLQEAHTPPRRNAVAITAALGTLHAMRLDYTEAVAWYRQATDLVPESARDERALSLEPWGNAALQAGDPAGAVQPLQQALALREHVLGPEHPDLAPLLSRLAEALHALRQDAKAEPLYQRAIRMLETALGPTHPDVAPILNNLAALYDAQRQYAKAEALYQRALTIREHAFGPMHPSVAITLNNLADLYYAQGQYARAEALYQRALTIREHVFGPMHPSVATSLHNLAALLHAQGHYTKAAPLYQRALAIREHTVGPEHPGLVTILQNLAALAVAQGQYADAELLYQRLLALLEKTLGPTHPQMAVSLRDYAAVLRHLQRTVEADTLETRARALAGQRPRAPDTVPCSACQP